MTRHELRATIDQHRLSIKSLPAPRPWRIWVVRVGAVLFWVALVAIAVRG